MSQGPLDEIMRVLPADLVIEAAGRRGLPHHPRRSISAYVESGRHVCVLKVVEDNLIVRLMILASHLDVATMCFPPWRVMYDEEPGESASCEGEVAWMLLRLIPGTAWQDITEDCIGSLIRAPVADRLPSTQPPDTRQPDP